VYVNEINLRHQTARRNGGTNDGPHAYVFDQIESSGNGDISDQDVLLQGVLLQGLDQRDEMLSGVIKRFCQIDVTDIDD